MSCLNVLTATQRPHRGVACPEISCDHSGSSEEPLEGIWAATRSRPLPCDEIGVSQPVGAKKIGMSVLTAAHRSSEPMPMSILRSSRIGVLYHTGHGRRGAGKKKGKGEERGPTTNKAMIDEG